MAEQDKVDLSDFSFLKNDGEMSRLMRKHDWTNSVVGAPSLWPQSLRTTLSIILNSRFPMFLFWGSELICFYNDAYRPSLGNEGKHPSILGSRAEDGWPDIWPVIKPLIDQVLLTGEATWSEDQLIPIYRNARMEDVYWTFSYSPVVDESGNNAGVFITCTETTDKIWSLQKVKQTNADLSIAVAAEQKARRSIEESEERFRLMAEGTDMLIALGNASREAIYFNKAWIDFTGRQLGGLLKLGWLDLIHPEDRDSYMDAYLTVTKSLLPYSGEFRVLAANGDYRWLLAKRYPRFLADKTFAGYISSAVDITERKNWEASIQKNNAEIQAVNEELGAANKALKKTEQELQETIIALEKSEARLNYIISDAPVGIGVLEGLELQVTMANARLLQFWGKTDQAIGKPLVEALPELVGQPYLAILDNVLTSGKPYFDHEAAAKLVHQGLLKQFYFDLVYHPLNNASGTTYGILIVATDVSSQVVSRRNVERAEESLRMAVEAAGLGSYHINVDDRIFVASPKLKEFFGFYPDEEVQYEAAIDQIHPDYRHAVADFVEAAITKGVRFDMEYPVIGRHDGKTRWVRGIGTLLHDSHEGKNYFTGVLHDITERKQDELRKNDFIGMVSHELKTPLTSLIAYIQILLQNTKAADDTFVRGILEKANNQAKKMTGMINGFLNVSRLESGKIHIAKTEFNIDQLLKEIIDDISVTVTTHRFVFHDCEAIYVYADRDKIGSVITNLLTNAVKYSPTGNLVEVNCKRSDGHVQIAVRDEGIGINEQDRLKLFERYYRVENEHVNKIGGFGIGLYLSAEIVHRHAGLIWVDSEAGKGSTFFFTIPLNIM